MKKVKWWYRASDRKWVYEINEQQSDRSRIARYTAKTKFGCMVQYYWSKAFFNNW